MPIWYRRWEFAVANCHGGWNLGTPFWMEKWVAIHSVVSHNTLKEGEIKECVINRKSHGYSLLGEESYCSFRLLAKGSDCELWLLTTKSECKPLLSVYHKKNVRNFFLHDRDWPHTNVHTTVAITKCKCSALTTQPWPSASDFHLTTSRNTITQMMRHCKTLCASGYRGSRESFRQKYMTLIKGERKLLPKMENMLKNKLSSVMV